MSYQDQNQQSQEYQENDNQVQDNQFEQDLAKLLVTIIQIENSIEIIRCQLADNDKFTCWEAFKAIDQGSHGTISSSDLKVFFANNHIAVHEHECDFLIYECTDQQDSISFNDFLKLILPRQDLQLRESCIQRNRQNSRNGRSVQSPELPFYLEEQLAKLFEEEIGYLRVVENQKIDLLNKYTQNFRDAFDIITRGQTDYINSSIMFDFLSSKYDQYEEGFYNHLEQRLDRDKSKTLTIDEFCNAIFPSDFIQRPPQPQKQSKNFHQLVYGDETQFLNYIRKNQRDSPDFMMKSIMSQQFQPEQYKFQNDINNIRLSAKNSNQSNTTLRKFLKTNMQFEKSFNLSALQQHKPHFQSNQQQMHSDFPEDTDEDVPQQQQFTPYQNQYSQQQIPDYYLYEQQRQPTEQNQYTQYPLSNQQAQRPQFYQHGQQQLSQTSSIEDNQPYYSVTPQQFLLRNQQQYH